MSRPGVHIASAAALGALFYFQGNFLAAYAVALGAIFPDIDDILPNFHRSWITHTAFVPSMIYYTGYLMPGAKALYTFLPFFTLGIVVHVVLDFVDYDEFKGVKLPAMPIVLKGLPPWVTLLAMLAPQVPFLLYGLV